MACSAGAKLGGKGDKASTPDRSDPEQGGVDGAQNASGTFGPSSQPQIVTGSYLLDCGPAGAHGYGCGIDDAATKALTKDPVAVRTIALGFGDGTSDEATLTPATGDARFQVYFTIDSKKVPLLTSLTLTAQINDHPLALTLQNLAPITGSVASPNCVHGTQSFSFTGAPQTFVVPALCTQLTMKVWGAAGGGGQGGNGGGGAYAAAAFNAVPGQTFTINVGEGGHNNTVPYLGAAGSYGGGGGAKHGGAGGGRSAVVLASDKTLYAIAGGGGGGSDDGDSGGAGGGAGSSSGSVIGGPGGAGNAGTTGAGGTAGGGGGQGGQGAWGGGGSGGSWGGGVAGNGGSGAGGAGGTPQAAGASSASSGGGGAGGDLGGGGGGGTDDSGDGAAGTGPGAGQGGMHGASMTGGGGGGGGSAGGGGGGRCGGGGGGYGGGGGGGQDPHGCGAGGGGSSYLNKALIQGAGTLLNANGGSPGTMTGPDWSHNAGLAGGSGADGGDGLVVLSW